MGYLFCLVVCLCSLVAAIVFYIIRKTRRSDSVLTLVLGMFGSSFIMWIIIMGCWTLAGGFNCNTHPEYNHILTDEVCIAEIDTKKSKTGIHDIAYVDTEKCIVYIDSTLIEKDRVTVYNGNEAHLEVYHCIPKNNFYSIDLIFNRYYEYKVYVPDEYKVVTVNLT